LKYCHGRRIKKDDFLKGYIVDLTNAARRKGFMTMEEIAKIRVDQGITTWKRW